MATEQRTIEAGTFRVPKTAELVATYLRNRIIRGELQEGDILPPEADLITEFGVSRPTLREALRVLESESLITIRRGAHGGARVNMISSEKAARYAGLLLQARGTTVADLYQCRMILEPAAVRILAQRRPRKAIKALRLVLARHDDVDVTSTQFRVENAHFHEHLLALAGNQTLAVLGEMLSEIIDLHAAATSINQEIFGEVVALTRRDHGKVVDLIEAGDAARAEKFWRDHLEQGMEAMLEGLGTKKVLDLLS